MDPVTQGGLRYLQLAKSVKSLEGKWDGYVMEPKFDGFRAGIRVRDGQVTIYSRSLKTQEGKLPHLEETLAGCPDMLLDGEICYVEEWSSFEGHPVPLVDFNKTMRVMGSLPERAVVLQETVFKPLVFVAFDLLELEGSDMTDAPDEVRRARLEDVVSSLGSPHIELVPRWCAWYPDWYDKLVEMGVEGVMMKNLEARYGCGKRTNKAWYKIKSEREFDVVMTGLTMGNGKFAGMLGAIEFSAYDDEGELQYIGRCSGMTDEVRFEVTHNWEKYKGTVMVVKCNELVGSGEFKSPRHPQFSRFRDDKLPEECLRDQFRA